jgi:hypothetical protein
MNSDRTIRLEEHIISALGLWYLEWQASQKDRLKKQYQSPKAFIDKHLTVSSPKSSAAKST